MAYIIKLTSAELNALAWATDRGYFPEETYDAMHRSDGSNTDPLDDHTDPTEHEWTIPEHAAWAITNHRQDDPDSLFACLGGSLLDKLVKLENSIV